MSKKMVLLFRPDALVRERLTGDLFLVSWKTASTFGQYTINQCMTDMQSMSEVWGVQNGKSNLDVRGVSDVDGSISGSGHPSAIEGVLYLFCVKGQRKFDEYLGFKVQNTPLAYGWVRKGPTPEDDEWAWQYGWATEEMNPKTGKPISTKLGKGFRKLSIWDNYEGGVKQWIDDLHHQRIEPRHINALDAIFPQMMLVSRRADEIESWKRQTVASETRIQQALSASPGLVEDVQPDIETLDAEFPQHTANCYAYMSKCQFWEACFTPAVKADPLASGLYQIRVPNHPSEKGDAE